jgi:hypothetical protein
LEGIDGLGGEQELAGSRSLFGLRDRDPRVWYGPTDEGIFLARHLRGARDLAIRRQLDPIEDLFQEQHRLDFSREPSAAR